MMPYLKINLNQTLSQEKADEFLKVSSQKLAEALLKPESYVMVELSDAKPLIFAGSTDAAAYVELKSIGLAPSTHRSLSKMICELLESQLNIPQARIYIEFSDIKGANWGWNASTF